MVEQVEVVQTAEMAAVAGKERQPPPVALARGAAEGNEQVADHRGQGVVLATADSGADEVVVGTWQERHVRAAVPGQRSHVSGAPVVLHQGTIGEVLDPYAAPAEQLADRPA